VITVYKYPLDTGGNSVVSLPMASRILRVDWQNRKPVLWALADTENEAVKCRIRFYRTGHPMEPGNRRFINTFFVDESVFHAFEEPL
jgi:hypothetical protein